MTRNIAASVRARLLAYSKQTRQDFSLVLDRYVIERFLYRLGASEYVGQFMLKGARLFDLWFDIPHRPTRDLDLLGFGSPDKTVIKQLVERICALEYPDGINYLPDSIQVDEIRKESHYAGIRVLVTGVLDNARSRVQIDIGFGDVVTPEPDNADYPVILKDFPAPRLRVYPRYTVVAEKLEALVLLGMSNSRMKDFYDLYILAEKMDFDGTILSRAVNETFTRRGTQPPSDVPLGLSEGFYSDSQKLMQWKGFFNKNKLDMIPLEHCILKLREFLLPVSKAVYEKGSFPFYWTKGGPWLPDKENP